MKSRVLRWGLAPALLAAACAAPQAPQAPTGPPGPAAPAAPAARFEALSGSESALCRTLLPAELVPPVEARTFHLMAVGDLAVVSVAVDSHTTTGLPGDMLDGNGATGWVNGGYRNPTAWAQLQVGGDATLTGVGLKTGPTAAGCRYDVQVSADGEVWRTVLANQTNTTWNMEAKAFPAGTTGKFVRIFWYNSATAPQAHFAIYEAAVRGSFTTGGGGATPTPAPSATPSAAPTPGPSATPSPVASGEARFHPDLHPVPSRNFYTTSVNGARLLRFPTTIGNLGPGHMRVRGQGFTEGQATDAYQEILDGALAVVRRVLVGRFYWHAEHNHIHLTDVARYELHSGSPTGPLLRVSTKVSFCLEDTITIRSTTQRALHTDCKSPVMGITRDWADFYNAGLPGQEFDVTGLAAGYYYVVIKVDPLQKFVETRRDNNTVWTRIWLDPAAGRTYPTNYSE